MKSAKRKLLKKYLNERRLFVATVQAINYSKNKLTVMDIYMVDEGKLKRVGNHLHVFNVSGKTMREISYYDIINFTAIPFRYRKNALEGKSSNYSLKGIDDINVWEVGYNGQ